MPKERTTNQNQLEAAQAAVNAYTREKDASVYSDLLEAAMSEVNWSEIVQALIDESAA